MPGRKTDKAKDKQKQTLRGLTKEKVVEMVIEGAEKFTNRLAFSFSACPYPLLLSPVWPVAS